MSDRGSCGGGRGGGRGGDFSGFGRGDDLSGFGHGRGAELKVGEGRGGGCDGGDGEGRGGSQRGRGYRGGYQGDGGHFRGEYDGGRGGRGGRGGGRGGRGRLAADYGLFLPAGGSQQPDAQLDAAADEFVRALASTPHQGAFPDRPDFGRRGASTVVRANYFSVDLPTKPLYQYDVDFSPSGKTAGVRARLFELLLASPDFRNLVPNTHSIATDMSKSIVSAHALRLPLAKMVVDLRLHSADQPAGPDGKSYTATVALVHEFSAQDIREYVAGVVRTPPYDAGALIRALNIVLAKFPVSGLAGGRKVVRVGSGESRFFILDTQPDDLGSGLVAYRGYYSSIRPTFGRVLCNINVCTGAFFKPQSLAAMIGQVCPDGNFSSAKGGVGPKSFDGLKVQTHYLGKPKIVTLKGLGGTAREEKFHWEEEKGLVTVEHYFKKKHAKTVDPWGRCGFWFVGDRKAFVPAELCTVVDGQIFSSFLTAGQTNRMLRVACRSPKANAELITGEGLRVLGHAGGVGVGGNPVLDAFGLRVSEHMEVVSARVLKPPQLCYRNRMLSIREHAASWNLVGVKFPVGGRLRNWAAMAIQDRGPGDFTDLNEFKLVTSLFVGKCAESGLDVVDAEPCKWQKCQLPPKTPLDPMRVATVPALRDAIAAVCGSARRRADGTRAPDFLLVMLSTDSKQVYSHIRTLVDCEFGIPTMCCRSDRIRKVRGQPQYLGNVTMKANLKLGGKNHGVANSGVLSKLLGTDTLVLGGDVTHPTTKISVKGTPSIAAIVGSYEPTYSLYPGSIRLQNSKQEMIQYLDSQVAERLAFYAEHNSGRLPQRILYFRDGVPESQYEQLVTDGASTSELDLIRKGCRMAAAKARKKGGRHAGASYSPRIAIIVCGKRHHTRFYPTEAMHTDGKGNSAPGTVVDRGVTSIANLDFYLQAHVGIQGTARSAHYYAIHDDVGFSSDDLQTLVHEMSYLFARATKSVSYVPPAYYADILCERGRCYLQALLAGHPTTDMKDVRKKAGPDERDKKAAERDAAYKEAEATWGAGPKEAIQRLMYYI